MSAPEAPAATSGPPDDDVDDGPSRPAGLGRATTTITIWNLISRLTGFVRVITTASALGIGALGDSYQRTNQVSNVLFELLAGGMLFSVLVPTFVTELRRGPREDASRLASALATRALVVLGVLVASGMLLAGPISDLLTANADAETRAAQSELGAILLLFILPQLLLYTVGSVASGLLQADHRFAATSAAPALNNVVVIATMIAFRSVHDPARGLDLTGSEQVLLGGGTLLGTLAMTVVPLVALRRAGLALRFRWSVPDAGLGALARRGMWGAGHVGLNEILVLATVLFAGAVPGGVIAYQTSFTFFLLPHALLAHPIFTALYPRLARDGAAGAHRRFAGDLAGGLRPMLLLLLPASALLAVVASPALSIIEFGQLDRSGTRLVALVLASYLLGLTGYSTFFLLTRAGYALDDARLPTIVNLGITAFTVAGMAVVTGATDGTAVLIGFGVVTSVVATLGSVALFLAVRARLGESVPVVGTALRAAAAAAAGAGGALAVTNAIGWDTAARGVAATCAGSFVGLAGTLAVLAALRTPELAEVTTRLRSRVGRGER